MKKVSKIIQLLNSKYGNTPAVISYNDPFKVLISTILSQRTRDENTLLASKRLFSKYDTPFKLANANLKDVENLIKPSGFFKIKAKRIIDISKRIVKDYNGKVPNKIGDLLNLKGVGRKTANCVLSYSYGKDVIPVDVHVHRISNRIGLVKTNTPYETEKELMKIVPKKYRNKINNLLVKLGRNVCKSIKPKCNQCVIKDYCNYYLSKK